MNEELLDKTIDHQVNLQRYSNGVVRRMIALLNRADADLFAQLTAGLERMSGTLTVERLEGVLSAVRQVNVQAHALLERELSDELKRFVEAEALFQQRMFETTIPAQIQASMAVVPLNPSLVYTAAYSQPFRGKLLREFASGLEADKMRRIREAVRLGYVEQQTIGEIVRRIRGTRAKGYSDGVIEIDRRNAESMVRTAVNHMAGFTRDKFYEANEDLVKGIQWVSTLDSRTTFECAVRDGKLYSLDHKPQDHSYPWLSGPGRLHWSCRSTSVPVLKSWRELGIPMDELSPGTRASMDGQVPQDITYSQWLKKQSAKRQDEVLGKTRAAEFRSGKVSFEKFGNDKGKWLTLEQLRERVPLAA